MKGKKYTIEYRGRVVTNHRGEKSYERKQVDKLPERHSLNQKDGRATPAQEVPNWKE